MSQYKITESVSGESEVIFADNPILALLQFIILHSTDINSNAGSWNWDFEVEKKR